MLVIIWQFCLTAALPKPALMQIELLFTTSNALTCADLDSEYFHAVKCHDSSLVNSLQATVQWIRSQRFDALFYPEVSIVFGALD